MAATEISTRANGALDDLYRHHVGEVYRYTYAVLGNHADAEDVTQTTFVNALRAPDYFRLDVRVDRTFSLAGEPFVLFGGVQNVTNRRNFAGYEWNRRTNSTEFTEQQGIFPILGFEYRF